MGKTLRLICIVAFIVGVGTLYAATPALTGLTCPGTVQSGSTFLCAVTGTPNAEIDIQSNTNAALSSIPDDCWAPPAQGKPPCQFIAKKVTSNQVETVTAKLGKMVFKQTITVTPGGPPPPPPPQLTVLVCAEAAITGAGTVPCTIGVSAVETAAATISLSSSSVSLAVPSSVIVAVGASSAGFNATAQAVTATTTATVTASLAGNTAKTSITLNTVVGPPPPVTLKSMSCAQPSITGAGTDTCTISLTGSATAAAPVNVTSNNVALTAPSIVTVPAGSSSASFTATAAAVTAQTAVTLTGVLNGSSQASYVVTLNPVPPPPPSYTVDLTWVAPVVSNDQVTGYNIYRATSTSGYQKLNSLANVPVTYTDNAVQSGLIYNYEVKSVDANGVESAPSNVFTAAIP